ncbi:MAG: alpha/beta hydrolase [Nesterenkonia sp.]
MPQLRAAVSPGSATMTGPGVLILHGFTSTTASMEPVAQGLEEAGFDVEMPLLPGHGTRWEDLAATRAEAIIEATDAAHRRLAARCSTVVPVGLSMGGALALRSAAVHHSPAAVVINPGLRLSPGTGMGARLLSRVRPTIGSIAGDIAKPGVTEEAYARTPLRAVGQLSRLFSTCRAQLPRLTERLTPVLLLRSSVDNVVGSASATLLKRTVGEQVQEVILRRSRHVATLDYDAELLQRRITDFLRGHCAPPTSN